MFFKVLGSSNPTRLFVAGIHGDEEAITRPIFEIMIKDIKIISGRLVVVSLSRDCPYISTLNEAYYDSTNGKKLLELIQEYRPGIYVELHTYKRDNHLNLIDPERRKKIGVPPFTELEEKVLIGSVSPLIRTSEFSRDDFCFTFENNLTESIDSLLIRDVKVISNYRRVIEDSQAFTSCESNAVSNSASLI